MIQINNISLNYPIFLLEPSNLTMHKGEIIALTGENGVGKTTLLYSIGLLEHNSQFDFNFNGNKINLNNEQEMAYYRREKIGYVFQDYLILEGETLRDTFAQYFELLGKSYDAISVKNVMKLVKLEIGLEMNTKKLSGGQKQRLALALSLIKEPELLILDEPTSHLDAMNSESIMDLLKEIAKKQKIIILIASHSKMALKYCDKVYELNQKKLICIKDSNEKEHEIVLNKPKPISLSFKMRYVLRYYKSNKLLNILMIIFSSFIISFCSISLVLKDGYVNRQAELYENMISREILVISQSIVLDDELKKIEADSAIESVCYFPLIPVEINQSIYVSVFKHDIDNMKKYFVRTISNEGIYISENLYQELNQPTAIELSINGKSERMQISATYDLSYNDPIVEAENLIYLDNMDNLPETNQFLVKVKSLEEMSFLVDNFNKKYKEVKSPSNELYQRDNDLKESSKIGLIFAVTLFIVSILMFIFVFIRNMESRKLDFALLKANGLTHKNLISLIFLEEIILAPIIVIVSYLWGKIEVLAISKLLDIAINTIDMRILINIFILVIINIILPVQIALKIVVKKDLIKILRR